MCITFRSPVRSSSQSADSSVLALAASARGRPLALVLSALVFAFLLCAALVPGAPSLRSSTISLETWQDLIHSHKGFYQKSFKPFAPLRPSGSLSDDDLANTLHVLSASAWSSLAPLSPALSYF